MQLGRNITGEVKGNELVIRIDLSKNLGRSKSGKSTDGNQVINENGVVLGLNCYKKA